MPNGTKTLYAYDQLERLTGMEHRKTDNTLLSSFGYGFDNVNNKDARQSLIRQVRGADNVLSGVQTVGFGYDTVDQLQEEATSGAAPTSALPQVAQSHRFDAMGNRTLWNDAQNKRRSDSIYNEVNQLTQSKSYDTNSAPATLLNTTNFGYDAKGNLTATASTDGSGAPSGSATYIYDDADRLTGITSPGSSKREFLYDGASRLRVSRNWTWSNGAWVPQSEKRRIYRARDVVQERDGANAVTANYTRLGNIGGILARSTSGGSVYFGYDGGGNVTELTDNTGAVVGTYAYDAFGNTVATSGAAASSNPYRFSAQEDVGGLYYYGYRFYSPDMSRWLNRDPLREAGGVNLYRMVENNPVNFVDPSGLESENLTFPARNQSWHAIKDRAGIPRSQSPERQWTAGNDRARQGHKNYHFTEDKTRWGRWYQYRIQTPDGEQVRIIAEHLADGGPHLHSYCPKEPRNTNPTKGEFFGKVGGRHHFYYQTALRGLGAAAKVLNSIALPLNIIDVILHHEDYKEMMGLPPATWEEAARRHPDRVAKLPSSAQVKGAEELSEESPAFQKEIRNFLAQLDASSAGEEPPVAGGQYVTKQTS